LDTKGNYRSTNGSGTSGISHSRSTLRASPRARVERCRFGYDVFRRLGVLRAHRGAQLPGPGRFTLACADANDYLTGLHWKSWGPRLASANGAQELNDCVPYCAAGHFHRYPVDVVLSHPAAAGPGSQRYTSITLLYPGAHPAYVGSRRPVTTSMKLPA
jgi:hypothetical protein